MQPAIIAARLSAQTCALFTTAIHVAFSLHLCALQVPHVLPVPFMNDYHSTHGMANYLKMVGPCTIAYPSKYAGEKAAGC